MLVARTLDPLGNSTQAAYNYRTLAPEQLTDPNGNLTRFARLIDSAGHAWIGNPKVVKTGMGAVKSMSFMFTGIYGDVRKDILYVTTKGGALKQIQVPWKTPGKPKVTTLKSTG